MVRIPPSRVGATVRAQVDNHGKAIYGLGAEPVNNYRRHDTQKAMLTGEST